MRKVIFDPRRASSPRCRRRLLATVTADAARNRSVDGTRRSGRDQASKRRTGPVRGSSLGFPRSGSSSAPAEESTLALTLGTPNRVKPKVDVFEAASEQLDRCGGHISDDCRLDDDRVRRRGLPQPPLSTRTRKHCCSAPGRRATSGRSRCELAEEVFFSEVPAEPALPARSRMPLYPADTSPPTEPTSTNWAASARPPPRVFCRPVWWLSRPGWEALGTTRGIRCPGTPSHAIVCGSCWRSVCRTAFPVWRWRATAAPCCHRWRWPAGARRG